MKFALLALFVALVAAQKTPVIIETDIGADADDFWALVAALWDDSFDIRAIAVSTFNTDIRAKIVAKILTIANRTDIPLIVGPSVSTDDCFFTPWAKDFDMKTYAGKVVSEEPQKAVLDILEEYKAKDEKMLLIELGPPIVFALAAEQNPEIFASTAYVSAMAGYVTQMTAEYNIKVNITASQVFYGTKFSQATVMAPFDTTQDVIMDGENYQNILSFAKNNALMTALIDAYKIFIEQCKWPYDPETTSTKLYDVVSVLLASPKYASVFEGSFVFSNMKMRVDDEGLTIRDDLGGKPFKIAAKWGSDELKQQFLNNFALFFQQKL